MLKLKKKLMRVTSGAGDKKRKQKQQQQQQVAEETRKNKQQQKQQQQQLPATSIDDVIFEEYDPYNRIKSHQPDNRKQQDPAEYPEEDPEEDTEARLQRNFHGGSRKMKIFSSFRKRFGGRATKLQPSGDTDAFLHELSTQIDAEDLHVIGDVEIVEEEEERSKFGEKWSYLPKDTKVIPAVRVDSLEDVETEEEYEDEEEEEEEASTSQPPPHLAPPLPELPIAIPAPKPILETNLDDVMIYDVPKPQQQETRRAHVNVVRRRHQHPNHHQSTNHRPMSAVAGRRDSNCDVRMQVWLQENNKMLKPPVTNVDDVTSPTSVGRRSTAGSVSGSFSESIFDKAKKRNFRISGVSLNLEDVFTQAEQQLNDNFDDVSRPTTRTIINNNNHHTGIDDVTNNNDVITSMLDLSTSSSSSFVTACDVTLSPPHSPASLRDVTTPLPPLPAPPPPPEVVDYVTTTNNEYDVITNNEYDVIITPACSTHGDVVVTEVVVNSLHDCADVVTSSPALVTSQDDVDDDDDVGAHQHHVVDEEILRGLEYEEERPHIRDDDDVMEEESCPPPLAIPPPPPIPPPPSVAALPNLKYRGARMSVKRINWEKIDPIDLESTVWGQLSEDIETINDVVKYLDLEEHFAVKRVAKKVNTGKMKKRMTTILAHKKAYNLSILLAHLKMTPQEIFDCLLSNESEWSRNKLDASHYSQLLFYCPDSDEWEKCTNFGGNPNSLNEADLFALKMSSIPDYEMRLRAFVFKLTFAEREAEIQKNFEIIQKASTQLRKSRKLAKILEFVLAMGNYMNQGNMRIAKATGFRIHFLAEMDCTKTSDNKLTFLHILARAVCSKFPEIVDFNHELSDVAQASRVVYPHVLEELQLLRNTWLELRDSLEKSNIKIKNDRFRVAMQTYLVRTNAAIKRLENLHSASLKDFRKVAQYFGENPKNVGMQQFFTIFDDFMKKFQKSHKEIKNLVKSKSTVL